MQRTKLDKIECILTKNVSLQLHNRIRLFHTTVLEDEETKEKETFAIGRKG